jgi:HK97 family phage portal protein
MGFLSKALQRRDGETTFLSNPAAWIADAFGAQRTDSGLSVTPKTGLTYSGVYACVNVISQTIAQVPWDVFQRDEQKKKKVVAKNRSEHYLLHTEPIPTMSSYTFRQAFMANTLLSGNGFIEIIRDGSARVKYLRPLPWWTVQAYESLDELSLVYKVTRRNGRQDNLDGSDVIHVPCMSIDGVGGLSIIHQHRQGIGLGLAAEASGAAFFGNGSRLSGFLSVEKPMRKDEREDLERKWFQRFGGARNTGKVPVLSGSLKWNQMSIPPADAQYIETRNFQLSEIARMYRVPAVLIGMADKTATYASADAFFQAFITFTMMPWATAVEQEFNRKLFPGRDDLYCKLDLNGLLRGDPKARALFYKTLFGAGGALCANEIRDWEDLDPIEGGDRHFVQQGFMPLDKVDEVIANQGKQAAAPKQDPQAGGTDGDDSNRAAHAAWMTDVMLRVAKWERKDSARIVEAMTPVILSFTGRKNLIGCEPSISAIVDELSGLNIDFRDRAWSESHIAALAMRTIKKFEGAL